MKKNSRVAILGAGFSGLTLARALAKKGIEVEIFEKAQVPGGLIQTDKQPVIVEHGAHAMLASQEVENLFRELELPLVKALPKSKSKWIFRKTPRKWPLGFFDTLLAFKLFFKKNLVAGETLRSWLNHQNLNSYLVAPALQGVYGAQTTELSASLVLGSQFEKALRSEEPHV